MLTVKSLYLFAGERRQLGRRCGNQWWSAWDGHGATCRAKGVASTRACQGALALLCGSGAHHCALPASFKSVLLGMLLILKYDSCRPQNLRKLLNISSMKCSMPLVFRNGMPHMQRQVRRFTLAPCKRHLRGADCLLQVGTYIGERLIYAPSLGFCILVAELIASLAGDALPQILLLWYSGGCK